MDRHDALTIRTQAARRTVPSKGSRTARMGFREGTRPVGDETPHTDTLKIAGPALIQITFYHPSFARRIGMAALGSGQSEMRAEPLIAREHKCPVFHVMVRVGHG